MHRVDKVMDIIAKQTPIDKIINVAPFADYYEVTGSAGGDILQYRIYNNGMITERWGAENGISGKNKMVWW